MTHRWPPYHSVHSYSHGGKGVARHRIFLWILFLHPHIHCCKSPVWQDVFCIPCFWLSPKGSSLVLQDQASRLARWCLWSEKCVCLVKLSWGHAWKSVLYEQLLQTPWCITMVSTKAPLNRQAVFQFKICSDIFGTPSAPTHLILQNQTTTFGVTSKVRYTKRILQMLMTWDSKFRNLFRGSIKKCYGVLQLPFHCSCSSDVTTWWSPTNCHIRPLIFTMNSHRPGVYLLVLIKFFFSAFEDVITFLKPLGFSGTPCVLFTHISRTVYRSGY